MKNTPQKTGTLRGIRLIAATVFTALFFIFLPVPPANACCVTSTVTDTTTTPAVAAFQSVNLAALGVLNGFLTSILATLTYLTNITMPAVSGSITSAITGHGMMTSDVLSKHGDFVVGNNQYIAYQSQAAAHQAEATTPNQASACAVQQYLQAVEQMNQNARNINGTHTALVLGGICSGTAANCSGAGRTMEQFYDLCNLGFLPPGHYGDLTTALGCKNTTTYPSDQSYIDRQHNMDLLINTYQMPVATPCILPDGYPYWSGTLPPNMNVTCQAGSLTPPVYNADPTKSQLAWVAAYKFCESLGAPPQTPIYTRNRQITIVDLRKVLDDQRVTTANVNGARNLCFFYLWERTAYPSASAGQAQSTNGDASGAQDQMNVCQAMMTAPNASNADTAGVNGAAPAFSATTGLGIQSDPYLQSCVNNGTGLSPLMVRKIMHNRCADYNWLPNVEANIAKDANTVEQTAQFKCTSMADDFESYIREEHDDLASLINKSSQMAANEARRQHENEDDLEQNHLRQNGAGDVPVQ